MKSFMREAKELSGNPLGIIALFISLIYGFACLLVASGIPDLERSSQERLIWFLIIFPFAILSAFVYLVVNHHTKLYAPKDYVDEDNFIKSIGLERQNKRIDEEVNEIAASNSSEVSDPSAYIDLEKPHLEKQHDTPVVEAPMDYSELQYKNSIRIDYMLIEELVMRKVEEEYKVRINRQASLQMPDGSHLEADGIAFIKKIPYIFEVKYIRGPQLAGSLVNNIRAIINNRPIDKLKYIFVVVHKKGNGNHLRKQLYSIFPPENRYYQFKFYAEENLKSHFNIS